MAERYVLLKVDPQAHPLYFVLRVEDPGNTPDQDAYFYDTHTCPTNWVGDIWAVVSHGDPDPHGFATFVRAVPVPEGDETGPEDDAWDEIFPEAFGG